MTDDSNRELALFTEALELAAEERAAFLNRACVSDEHLRRKVEALLKAYERTGDFLEHAPTGSAVKDMRQIPVGEKPGDRIGSYKLLQQIGEGGCGVVFMAEQEEPVHRRVALKILKPGMDTKSVIARFEAERQALALMDHPNIAKIFDAGATESGRPYFVMELIRGSKITDFCDQHSLTTKERLELFVQVCLAVQHAHQKGVIHRDIKPSNILVTASLEGAALPVVIDFGIAKAATNQRLTDKTLFTAFEMLIGTPAYMSPEQAELTSVGVDTRTDIYSLGVLLYELLAGSTPFDTTELLKAGLDEIRRIIRDLEPVRPSTRLSRLTGADLTTVAQHRKSDPPKLIRAVCGDLDWIVMKALEKDRTRRYETANGLLLDVKRYLAGEAISARPPSNLYKFQRTVLRNKLLFAGLGVITSLLVVGLVVISTSLARERQARRAADIAFHQAEAGKTQAQTEAAKSKQVTRFLENMLEGVGPSAALGRDTTMLREILDRTAERVGLEMTNQPPVEAELRSLIGRLYMEIGIYDRAEKMHRAALEINRQILGTENQKTADTLRDLGVALWKQDNLTEAETAHSEALAIRRRLFGNGHADVATSLNDLGTVYRHQRKLHEAESLIREALGIRRNLFGNEHPEVADSLHNLTIVLADQNRGAEAEATARDLLAMRRRLHGPEHPAVAWALMDLSYALGYTGKLDEADSVQREALALERKLLGDEHPEVSIAISSLGERLRQRGNLTEAHSLSSAALAIQRKVLGVDSPAYRSTLASLALTLEQEGKWPEAEAAHRETLALWRKRARNEDPQAISEMEGVARALMAQKKFGEAERFLVETLTSGFLSQPQSVNLLIQRVELMGRRGRWQEAADDAALVVNYQPTEHYRYHTLAPLLVITHDRSAYEKLCGKLPTLFPTTMNPYIAERVSKDCLLLPGSGEDLIWAAKMAESAIVFAGNNPGMAYFQLAKAVAQYRLGRFTEALEWAEKSFGNNSEAPAQANACAIIAMAHWQLGHTDLARECLIKGNKLTPNFQPMGDNEEIGGAWVAWLFARIQLDEAAALIPLASPTGGPIRP